MAFVDELKIKASAGRGGDGVVRWRREKFLPKGGPAGGNGGRGGDFRIRAVRDIGVLARHKARKDFVAGRGEDGRGRGEHGHKGEDFILDIPIGSIVKDLETGQTWILEEEGQTEIILKGGYGGYGNEHFKGSTNTTPKQAYPGQEGEEGEFSIEVELFADLGLVGLPNAGKSSLLNILTNATAKVGSYAFTTLDPNLGDFYGFIIADIPGLIEGASGGKGLGTKFLRHIKKTKMLAHLVSLESEDAFQDYEGIRKELETYGHGLADKEEIIILSKSDTAKSEKIEKYKNKFQELGKEVFIVSLYDDASIKDLADGLVKLLREKI